MKSDIQRTPRRVGRPSSFNRDAALNQAMLLFWRHGYENTSIAELTVAMEVKPPKLYSAFGDKRALFIEAVQKYTSGEITSEGIIADAQTAQEAAHNLLLAAAKGFTGKDTPSGCLLATAVISCSSEAEDVRLHIAEIRSRIESLLRKKIEASIASGHIDPNNNPSALARYIMAVIQGMSTLARDGATQFELIEVVSQTMKSWPGKVA